MSGPLSAVVDGRLRNLERENPFVPAVRCQLVRWIDDEPQPGWVEARLADVNGRERPSTTSL
jgi:hypothetical protein